MWQIAPIAEVTQANFDAHFVTITENKVTIPIDRRRCLHPWHQVFIASKSKSTRCKLLQYKMLEYSHHCSPNTYDQFVRSLRQRFRFLGVLLLLRCCCLKAEYIWKIMLKLVSLERQQSYAQINILGKEVKALMTIGNMFMLWNYFRMLWC